MPRLAAVVLLAAALLAPAAAHATPVATSDAEYQALGRVFPDPLGGCRQAGIQPCSPTAQGNVPATQFIGYQEFISGMTYLNSKPEWQRYLEVWPLDGKAGDNEGDEVPADPKAAFPGNGFSKFEFTPKAAYRSAGLPQTGGGRTRNDLFVVRVTDEHVPDAGKQRYAVSLSIHGIERAGVEGGTRAIEDLVTAYTAGTGSKGGQSFKAGDRIVPDGTIPGAPTFGDVLKKAIIYVIYPNPDGWRRGSVSEGGVFFQRYNGNGVDLNRDWPDRGFAFRPYSALSEPESQALAAALGELRSGAGDAPFGAAVDLHGQLTADALSYTLIGHGFKDFAKDIRVRETAKAIHQVSEKALAWSPLIVPNDTPKSQNGCSTPVTGDSLEACAKIYGQTWGTVYDTINYTTTGALGDWMDSAVGLDTDGLDNEMSFSHLDRNIVFDPQGEQLHVDGNKALMYAQLAQMINKPGATFDARGRTGYVPNARLRRDGQQVSQDPPPGTSAQAPIKGQTATPEGPDRVVFPFTVEQDADTFSGGLRVGITKLNAQGIGDGSAVTTLKVQCLACDDHPGVKPDADEWVTVAEDYNQAPTYAQAGLTAAVNRPLARNREGKPVQWRAVLEGTPVDAGATMDVAFTQGPATVVGDTSGAVAPRLAAYDVANTDVFRDWNRYAATKDDRFTALDPAKVASGEQSLDGLANLVLADVVPAEDGFWAKVREWVRGGGNLLLTDGGLRGLPKVAAAIPADAVKDRKQYVGQISFLTAEGKDSREEPLVGSPLTVAQPGARFNSNVRRQMYEATPLGFAIQQTSGDDVGGDAAESPAWDVARAPFEKAGGKVLGTAVASGAAGEAAELDRVALGELPLGQGRVRVLGAVLPQPTERFDRDFGLEPYAPTYTGFILLCNLLDATCSSERPGAAADAPAGGGAGAKACAATAGFRSARVTARRGTLRFAFARAVDNPVTVDVFQSSQGRRVVRERRVAHFAERAAPFAWSGRVRDGVYFVRLRVRVGAREDVRRFVVRRSKGAWSVRKVAHHRRASCGLLPTFKLTRPAFRGSLGIAYRVGAKGRATVTVLRGRRVVQRFPARAVRRGVTYRLRFARRGARGDYRVRITVKAGARKVTASLISRRL
ncbi:MAG: hypothetical protein HZB46_18895 [Solirubrobacterales bacterium]|nr:hypothetical protein [Solirubrobacterales bacterium]